MVSDVVPRIAELLTLHYDAAVSFEDDTFQSRALPKQILFAERAFRRVRIENKVHPMLPHNLSPNMAILHA